MASGNQLRRAQRSIHGRRFPETFAAAHSPSGRFIIERGPLVHTSQLIRNLFLKTTRGELPVMVQGWPIGAVCNGSIGRC